MSEPFRALPAADLARSLEELLLPRLAEAIRRRVAGHCMSVLDLGADLMVPLANGVRRQVPTANVHVLTDDPRRDERRSPHLLHQAGRAPQPAPGRLVASALVRVPAGKPADERRGFVRTRDFRGVLGR